jgi:exopolysaccharide biosynthesis polyprenyl glycosylphosphotransferase
MLGKGEQPGKKMGKITPNLLALDEKFSRRSDAQRRVLRLDHMVIRREGVLAEDSFRALLMLERRRAERSRKPFVLMLLDGSAMQGSPQVETFLQQVNLTLVRSTRETDLIGWYKQGAILAVLFTEVSLEGQNPMTEVLHSKVVAALRQEFDASLLSHLRVTVHLFPEDWSEDGANPVADVTLYPDLSEKKPSKQLPRIVKRVIDIAGSAFLLCLLSPLYALIALAIKLTSKGDVIFKQDRLGQLGGRFHCLKFRTMYSNNDPKIHQDYIAQFIAGQTKDSAASDATAVVYKLTNDPRVTPIGSFLRRTSLDELPQFWNVLRGEMSLVGPRPPVPYEFKIYDVWHRRRVLEVKPGVTGLWQVSGRSRTSFDDMVRLDLRYCQSWSLWLDLKILVATPRAVLTGEGAY